MAFLDGKRERATILIILVGLAVAIGLWPFSSGLIGAPVLYVAVAPLYRWLARRMPPSLAALLSIAVVAIVILGLGGWLVTLLVEQARELASGVLTRSTLAKLQTLRVGPYDVGPRLQEAATQAAQSVGAWTLALLGSATRTALQLTIAFFGLYFLLTQRDAAWAMINPLIPFSDENSERLRHRFKDVTASTLIGTVATAAVQALFLAVAFWAAGFPNLVLWAAVTFVVSILPVIGSGLVWIPATLILVLDHRYVTAGLLVLWCFVVVGNIDNLIRPWIFRRFAQIHPFTTIIGAFAGIEYFGLLGLMIGPLMISYFFELIEMYGAEYGTPPAPVP
jgi:predicted PurR-regulated permease PerM